MTVPAIDAFDHVHLMVADRAAAERWYREVLGLTRVPELEMWTTDGGPLTLRNAADTVHLALFERTPQPSRTTIALRVDAGAFIAWRAHLQAALGRPLAVEDHDVALSIYFSDPDGNPFEITSYEHAVVRELLAR